MQDRRCKSVDRDVWFDDLYRVSFFYCRANVSVPVDVNVLPLGANGRS